MKNLIIMLFLAIGFCVLPSQAVGQTKGYWVEKYDPITKQTTMYYVRKPLIPKVRPKYSPENSGTANTIPANEPPVYQSQTQKTVRQSYDVGLSPYTRRPYGSYSRSTETTTVTVTTNDRTYQPQIVVDRNNGSYSWPRNNRWPW